MSHGLLHIGSIDTLHENLSHLDWRHTSKRNVFTAKHFDEHLSLTGALDEASQLTGRCTLLSSKGDQCTGTFVAGKLAGQATLSNLTSKQQFKGIFIDGKAIYSSGQDFKREAFMISRTDLLHLSNPDRYPVQFDFSCLKWKGTSKEDEFTAERLEEKFTLNGAIDQSGGLTGRCTIVSNKGDSCEGAFVAGKLAGEVKIINAISHQLFRGNFIDGKAMYCAEYQRNNKTIYTDQDLVDGRFVFVKNHPTDQGRYTGQWLDGCPHGVGKMIYENGACYDGTWEKGKRFGEGIYEWTLTERHFFMFRSIRCASIAFRGNWKEGEPVGEGELNLLSSKGKINLKGTWSQEESFFRGTYSIQNSSATRIEVQWSDYRYRHRDPFFHANFLIFSDVFGRGKLKLDSVEYEGELFGLMPNVNDGKEFKSVYQRDAENDWVSLIFLSFSDELQLGKKEEPCLLQ